MTLWYGDPSDRDTELHQTMVDFSSPVDLLAICTVEFLPAWEWGTNQQICKKLRMTVGLNWAWCRNQPPRNRPQDDLTARNSRCAACGWLTRRDYIEEEQCYECHNIGVCRQCTYRVPNNMLRARDRVDSNSTMQQRCLQCELLPGVQTITSYQRNLSAFLDSVSDRYDATFRIGAYSDPDRFIWPRNDPYLHPVWRLPGVRAHLLFESSTRPSSDHYLLRFCRQHS